MANTTIHFATKLILMICLFPLSRQLSPELNAELRPELIQIDKDGRKIFCEVTEGNQLSIKKIGEVWVSSENPCKIQSCSLNRNKNQTEVLIRNEECRSFSCSNDSELKTLNGTCCNICVKTKCLYNNTVYDVGKMWYNYDDCTLLECVTLSNGVPHINVNKKRCPTLTGYCRKTLTNNNDCCKYCKSYERAAKNKNEVDDVWTERFYGNHPCVRTCKNNQSPMTCHYKFVVEWYQTLSKACFNCPQNITDCDRPHCIIADGVTRTLTVVNRMMPGPTIEVCHNDTIIVDVQNDLLGETTSIHWHGVHQISTPYMDGVPYITQCPIMPHSTFRYTFAAQNPGTHFWHSHTAIQRGDGLFGALIIKRPRSQDPHSSLYDFDLAEHKMILQDWIHMPGINMFSKHYHASGDNKPRNLLINGRGRYYYAIWNQLKTLNRIDNPKYHLKTSFEQNYDHFNFIELNKSMESKNLSLGANNDSHLPTEVNPPQFLLDRLSPESKLVNRGRRIPAILSTNLNVNSSTVPVKYMNIALGSIPLKIYNVEKGFRYRFRIINAEFLNCPIAISIDSHELIAINSDGYDFEAVKVGSIVTYAGERFDFILHTNQPINNYWIRLKGLMDCSEKFTSAFQVAILRYAAAPNEEPHDTPHYNYKPQGVELNSMNKGPGIPDTLTVGELRALPYYDSDVGINNRTLKLEADYKFFVYYDFYPKNNPSFHPNKYYGFHDTLNSLNRVYTPQLNHISLINSDVALLPSRYDINDSIFCNETSLANLGINCREEFCQCHHVLQIPLGAIIEIIIVDEGFTFDANHPFHLHGNAFRVISLERLGQNVTIEMIKKLDEYKLLRRNLERPPIKDTVTVPDGGYTILRFEASNPGFWLFHCHVEFHAEIGMALILKVGNNDEMPSIPKNFPMCHNYLPDDENRNTIKPIEQQGEYTTSSSNVKLQYFSTNVLFFSIILALLRSSSQNL